MHPIIAKILKSWVKHHNLNPDNYLFFQETSLPGAPSRVIAYVYNKAFPNAFLRNATISERQYSSDFVIEIFEGSDRVLVTTDLRGHHGGALLEIKKIINEYNSGPYIPRPTQPAPQPVLNQGNRPETLNFPVELKEALEALDSLDIVDIWDSDGGNSID